jgi:lysophospholipase L1-like esterase
MPTSRPLAERRLRPDRARWAALGLGLVFALVIFEVGGRVVISRILAGSIDLDVDHRLRPNPLMGINEDGIRTQRRAADFTDDTYNVVFLGDSFTFGLNVEAASTFPEQVGRLWAGPGASNKASRGAGGDDGREVRVANFGWTSSSPILSLRLLRDIGEKYSPDLVVLCLDLSDFQDDIRYERMLREQSGLTLSPTLFVLRQLGLDRLSGEGSARDAPDDRLFLANQPLDRVRPHLALTEQAIGDIAEHSRSVLNADFVLVGLPRGFMYDAREHPNWRRRDWNALGPHRLGMFEWLGELADRVDYPVLPLLGAFSDADAFPTCFGNDPHYNARGHRIAARAIAAGLDDVLSGPAAAKGSASAVRDPQ